MEESELTAADGIVTFRQVKLEGTAFSTENLEFTETLTMKVGLNLSVRSGLTFDP
jgi:hypothetical protein